MTNLNEAKIGFNQFCGPAVLSILTGKNSDECASVISFITGNYKVKGVLLSDLLKAASKLGFDNEVISVQSNSLFGNISRMISNDGIYIVTAEKHFVVIEINNKRAYFCDNHTKEVIQAASSARLGMKVININRVFKAREEEKIPKPPEPKFINPAEFKVISWQCIECNGIGGPKLLDVIHYNSCSKKNE